MKDTNSIRAIDRNCSEKKEEGRVGGEGGEEEEKNRL